MALQHSIGSDLNKVTAITCVNAAGAGGLFPPHIIVKGNSSRALHGFDTQSAPEGDIWSASSLGRGSTVTLVNIFSTDKIHSCCSHDSQFRGNAVCGFCSHT